LLLLLLLLLSEEVGGRGMLVASSATSRLSRRTLRRMKEYQWFLTWLSVRPGKRLAISLHLLPTSLLRDGGKEKGREGQYRCVKWYIYTRQEPKPRGLSTYT